MHYILEKLGRQQCYIMGDFNPDLLKHEKHPPTEQFLDMMYYNAYIPLINRPTRITKETSTLIDNIFTNNYDIEDSLYSGLLQTFGTRGGWEFNHSHGAGTSSPSHKQQVEE